MMYECEASKCPEEGTFRAPDGSRWCEPHAAQLECPEIIAEYLGGVMRDSDEFALSPYMDDDTGGGRVHAVGRDIFIDTGRNTFKLHVTRTRKPFPEAGAR